MSELTMADSDSEEYEEPEELFLVNKIRNLISCFKKIEDIEWFFIGMIWLACVFIFPSILGIILGGIFAIGCIVAGKDLFGDFDSDHDC